MMMEAIKSNFNWIKHCPYEVKQRPGGKWIKEPTKKGASDDQNEEEAKNRKEIIQRNIVVIHQPHLLLLQKVIHLKENG